jgi:hypothetical protein
MSALPAPSPSGRAARSRAATRELWLDRIARFPLSGLTAAQFCAIEAVSLPSFYAWKRRLAAEPQRHPGVRIDTAPSPNARLLPVRLTTPGGTPELVLATGAVLRLPPGCDLTWVRSLAQTLGDAPC